MQQSVPQECGVVHRPSVMYSMCLVVPGQYDRPPTSCSQSQIVALNVAFEPVLLNLKICPGPAVS